MTGPSVSDMRSEIYSEFCDLLSGFAFETDAEYRIVKSAGEFPHLNLLPLRSAVGCSLKDIARSITDPPVRETLVDLLERRETVSRLRCGPGRETQYRCYEFSAAPVTEKGEFIGCRGIIIDVTTPESAEAAIRADHHAARLAHQMRGEFLASISHELRTPLNAIIGFSEIINAEVLGPLGDQRYRDYAGDILSSGQHLLDVINDMLDISRLETGEVELREDEISLGRIVEACLQPFKPLFAEKDIRFSVAVDPALPRLWADSHAVQQMLAHLLSNARKFVEPGGRVTISAALSDDGSLCLNVSDTGIGISPDDMDYILTPFIQGDPAVSKRHAGSGLGLPITKALMDLHGGRLKLASRLGEGTQVMLVFPPERLVHAASGAARRVG